MQKWEPQIGHCDLYFRGDGNAAEKFNEIFDCKQLQKLFGHRRLRLFHKN